MIFLTENMNGEEINLLLQKCEREQDYWIMFERLNKELEKRYQQILPISVYIRFLNQTQKYTNTSSFQIQHFITLFITIIFTNTIISN